MIGKYYDDPVNLKNILYFSLIPYYITLFILVGLYIYLSPGFVVKSPASSADMLIRKEIKQMEFYQVIMVGIYLFALALYPIIFLVFIFELSQK